VKPERWAELARLPDAERDTLVEHADACPTCATIRRRVETAVGAMREVAAAPAPNLNWEHVGARLYWSVSSEIRQRDRKRSVRRNLVSRVSPYALVGAAAAAGISLVFMVRTTQPEKVATVSPPVKAPAVIELTVNPPIRPARPAPIQGLVTMLQGEARLGGALLSVDATLRAGDKIETGAGRVAVQFGERSAFQLGTHTRVELRAFDEREVVLAVTGTIDVDVEKRHEGQRMAVVAGTRTVEVRGTAFRVGHGDEDLLVAVTRGRVTVLEGDTAVEVPAGTQLSLAAGKSLAGVAPRALIQPGVAAPRSLGRIPTLPTWTNVDSLRTQTAVLSVAAPPRVAVRVDGVEMGKGSFALRTTPGRHLVEGGAGAPRWVEVEQGATTEASVSITGPSESERPGQVDAELRRHRGRFIYCGDRVRKVEPGFTGSIQVEIGIEADGSVRFVAPVEGFEDPDVETCVLDVIRTLLTFPSGSKATVQKVIRF
jgi:hypothetical protein